MKRVTGILTLAALVLMLLFQQLQIDHLRAQIEQEQADVIHFMEETNHSINDHSEAIIGLAHASQKNSQAILTLAGK